MLLLRLLRPGSPDHSLRWGCRTTLFLVGLACALVYIPSAQAVDCTDKYRPVLDRAFGGSDIDALSRFLNSQTVKSECPISWHDSIRLKATQVVANEAERRVSLGDIASAEQLLLGEAEANFSLASFWSINAVLGDIARKRQQWKLAAQQYGEAYELAATDSALNALGKERAEAIQIELFRLASESLRLSEDLSVAISRSGSGSGTLSSRGFKPVAIPLPVTFEFNSHQLGSEGIEQANLIANYIASQSLEQITLTGHTDWQGCSAYNQQLSERRANSLATAIEEALKSRPELNVKISAHGLGEDCPPILSASGDYSEEQREDLARRVEISLSGSMTAATAGSCDLQLIKNDGPEC